MKRRTIENLLRQLIAAFAASGDPWPSAAQLRQLLPVLAKETINSQRRIAVLRDLRALLEDRMGSLGETISCLETGVYPIGRGKLDESSVASLRSRFASLGRQLETEVSAELARQTEEKQHARRRKRRERK